MRAAPSPLPSKPAPAGLPPASPAGPPPSYAPAAAVELPPRPAAPAAAPCAACPGDHSMSAATPAPPPCVDPSRAPPLQLWRVDSFSTPSSSSGIPSTPPPALALRLRPAPAAAAAAAAPCAVPSPLPRALAVTPKGVRGAASPQAVFVPGRPPPTRLLWLTSIVRGTKTLCWVSTSTASTQRCWVANK